jgi:Holliday junction resolvase RusA-like endonuclease
MPISQTFDINPVPASRPRVSRWSTYYPKKYTQFKKDMYALLSVMDITPSEKLVCVHIDFKISIPKSWSKKKKREKENSYCDNNSDIDNYIKAALDSFNGFYFVDDKQVVEIFARKRYSSVPCIKFKILEIKNDD